MSTIVIAIASVLVLTSTSLLSAQAEARNITAVIRINEQSILERAYLADGPDNLNDAWFTINEERYDNGSYDMSDWVWESDDGFNDSPLNRTIVLPQSDYMVKICLEDDWEYKSCKSMIANQAKDTITFLYPR